MANNLKIILVNAEICHKLSYKKNGLYFVSGKTNTVNSASNQPMKPKKTQNQLNWLMNLILLNLLVAGRITLPL